jgi:hypothetical protein
MELGGAHGVNHAIAEKPVPQISGRSGLAFKARQTKNKT